MTNALGKPDKCQLSTHQHDQIIIPSRDKNGIEYQVENPDKQKRLKHPPYIAKEILRRISFKRHSGLGINESEVLS